MFGTGGLSANAGESNRINKSGTFNNLAPLINSYLLILEVYYYGHYKHVR